ncbi:hypothetical protein AC249_AIPGENE17377 [Exaiptasia diaphana]|nr:hypothetical protein AC249_AIPGENE17377 [Exaiptasia diaphana]
MRKKAHTSKSASNKQTTCTVKYMDDTSEQCPVTKTKQHCKIKCQKGHCMKSPDLPVIAEGDSIVEEEESENSKVLGNKEIQCNCNSQCPDPVTDRIVIECETGSDSSNGSSDATAVGHDSGYED